LNNLPKPGTFEFDVNAMQADQANSVVG